MATETQNGASQPIGWPVTDTEDQPRLPSRDRVGAVGNSPGTTRHAGPDFAQGYVGQAAQAGSGRTIRV